MELQIGEMPLDCGAVRRLLPIVLVATALMMACGSPTTGSGGTSSSARTESSSTSSTTTSSATTPDSLACKLAVASGDAPSDGTPTHGSRGKGGFVDGSTAAFTNDPRSLGAYDRKLDKWLPVGRAWVSPDGQRYAYGSYPQGARPASGVIHVVDAVTGADRPLSVPAPAVVVDYAPEGIYFSGVHPYSDASATGLSLLDPQSGSYRQITAERTWTAIGGGYAWGVDQDQSIAPAPQTGPGAVGNRVQQLKLSDASISTWFRSAGTAVTILALDPENKPVLGLLSGGNFAVRAGGAQVYSAAVGSDNPAGPGVTDARGTWLGSASGAVWLYRSGQLRKLATAPLQPVVIAGGCD